MVTLRPDLNVTAWMDRCTMGLEFAAAPIGVLVLLFSVWALIHVGESRAPRALKALWIALILVIPILGFLLWLVLGPRSAGRALF
ncbi:MAG: PLD nuclease N-terminal domain-containing protein [Pseudomonadota bacterium]